MIQIDMPMPSSCYDCSFIKNERTNDYGSFCECGILEDYETINLLEHSKHPNCPLIEQEPILDKIRAEIEQGYCEVEDDYDRGRNMGLYIAMQIIDHYKAESEADTW